MSEQGSAPGHGAHDGAQVTGAQSLVTSLEAAGTERHGGPEVDHGGEVLVPAMADRPHEDRPENPVLEDPTVKGVHEPADHVLGDHRFRLNEGNTCGVHRLEIMHG